MEQVNERSLSEIYTYRRGDMVEMLKRWRRLGKQRLIASYGVEKNGNPKNPPSRLAETDSDYADKTCSFPCDNEWKQHKLKKKYEGEKAQ